MFARELTGAILAVGGPRQRAILNTTLAKDGITILDRLLATLRACCGPIIVIADSPCAPCRARSLSVYPPAPPGQAPLRALYTALMVAPTEHVFVCAVTMPFVDEALIRYLASFAEGTDAVVPRDLHGLQPMHGIYSRQLIPMLDTQLTAGLRNVEDFIEAIDAWVVPPDEVAAIDPTGLAFLDVGITSQTVLRPPKQR
jgi:molybdopterin-guanine dinucleotide biosynthesis protein A